MKGTDRNERSRASLSRWERRRNVTEETMGMNRASRQELDQGPPAKAVSRPTVTLSPLSSPGAPYRRLVTSSVRETWRVRDKRKDHERHDASHPIPVNHARSFRSSFLLTYTRGAD